MKNQINQLVALLVLLAAPGMLLAADRYWVHKPFYENTFSTPAELADWNLVEDSGTGSWQLTGNGTAILTMDDGDYANRLFNVNEAAERLLPLDIANGRVEILVGATTGGDQQIFVQAELFTASNAYITQINLLAPQNATGFFSIDLKDYSWDPNADKIRFIIGGANYSGQQGTVTFDYFSYSNDGGGWSNSANWSATPGGGGGASVPGAGDIAIFDGSGGSNGSCVLTADQNASGIEITADYSGNLDLEGFALNVGSDGVTIGGGGIAGNGAIIGVVGNVIINGGAITNAAGKYFLSGDMSLTDGILDFADDAVHFVGTGEQRIQTAPGTSISALIVDKPAGDVILQSDVLVTDVLTLTAGRVRTQSNTLQLGTSDALPGQLTAGGGEVDGTLSRWVSSVNPRGLEYPLGNAQADAPVTLEVLSLPTNGGTYSVTYRDAETPASVPVGFSDGDDVLVERSVANWEMQVSRLSGGSFSLSAANDHLGQVEDLSLLHFTQASSVVGTHVTATGTLSNPQLRRTGLTATELANTWYAASEATALPLTWVSFAAVPESESVLVNWSTLRESGTSHFIVEHAVDGRAYTPVARVEAAGDHDGLSDYQYEHHTPAKGINYYRLQQVDLDGSTSFSTIATARLNRPAGATITNLVNPIREKLRLTVQRRIDIRVISLDGRIVLSESLNPGDHSWDCSSWGKGLYQIITSAGDAKGTVYRVIKY